MIRHIVDRCHVGEPNLAVIKYVISRLKRKYKTWAVMPRGDRKTMMREIIRIHRANRKLYNDVMKG
jgi:hypothetical protein